MPTGALPTGALRLAGFGSFHVGGRQVRVAGEPVREIQFTRSTSFPYDPNGLHQVEQAYVQYFIPEIRADALPVVLLHGGGFSGAMWETTPDGRPGWVELLLRRGLAVYNLDNVERGRAGWCALPGVWPGEPIARSAEEAWHLFRFGRREDFASRSPFPGQRFPVAALDRLMRGSVPRWLTTGEAALAALLVALEHVGPCCLVAHSQGGEVALRATERRPDLVPCLVTLEASGFADEPAAFAGRSLLLVTGDYMNATPLWIGLAERTEAFAAALSRAGARVTRWRLPEVGISGNSHMMMMDDNSAELAAMVAQWILDQGGAAPDRP